MDPTSIPPPLPRFDPAGLLRVGRFEVLGELGRGAMGVVLRARDPQLDREVALKVLTDPEQRPDAVRRHLREAEVAARLSHPGIVRIFEVGEATDHATGAAIHYLAMDKIEGTRLSAQLTRMSLEERIRVLQEVAEAVGAAHAQGVVHRDLKPANILIRQVDGRAVVTDFGLARDLEATTRLTRTGAVLGTIDYMSPEQLSGQTDGVGPRSDVWALGVLLYQSLTSVLPFERPTAIETLQAICEQPTPRPRARVREAPEPLERICLMALAKDPAERYPDAAALAADLARYNRGEPIEARRGRSLTQLAHRVRRHPWRAALVLWLATCTGVLGVGLVTHRTRLRQLQSVRRTAREAHARRDWAAVLAACRRGPDADPELAALARDAAAGLLATRQAEQARLTASQAQAGLDRALARLARRIDQGRHLIYEADPDRQRDGRQRLLAALAELASLRARPEATPGRARIDGLIGRGWLHAGQLARAEAALQRAVDAVPADATSHGLLGQVLIRQMHGAALSLSTGVGDGPSATTLRASARRLLDRARAHLERARRHGGEADVLQGRIFEAFRLLASADSRAIETACIEALKRWGDETGCEAFYYILGWARIRDARLSAWAKAIELSPGDAWLRFVRATVLASGGRDPEALADLDVALAIDPDFLWARNTRGALRSAHGRLREALEDLDHALRLDPTFAPAYSNRAHVLEGLGRLEQARETLDTGLPHASGRARAELLARRGHLWLLLRRPERALADAQAALEIETGHLRALVVCAMVHRQSGRLAEARRQLDLVVARAPRYAIPWGERGLVRLAEGDRPGALSDLGRAIALAPRDPRHLLNRSLVRSRGGDRRGALVDLDRAVALAPELVQAYINRCALHIAMGDTRRAEADGRRALALDPGNADALVNLASIRRDAGNYAGAIRLLDQALAVHPRHVDALHSRAHSRQAIGDPEGAIADTTAGLAIAPRHALLYALRADARVRLKRYREAETDYRTAVRLAPGEWRALANGVIPLMARGKFDEALDWTRRAARLAPPDGSRRQLLARAVKIRRVIVHQVGRQLGQAIRAARPR